MFECKSNIFECEGLMAPVSTSNSCSSVICAVLCWCSYWRDLHQLHFERLEWRMPSLCCVAYINLQWDILFL